MKHLILIVDDDEDILKVLEANLRLHGFETFSAMNCQEAREWLADRIPDLIVLDLMLPDGDGVQFCQELRAEGLKVPIIMLTARDKVSDRVLGLDSGADDYVVKPFEAIELVARIKACLRRYEQGWNEPLKVGEVEIDPQSRTVTLSGKPVELTAKEFDLLYLLARNCGKVLTREEIKRQLWKDPKRLYSWSRVIDVHIQHLRKKIEKDSQNPRYILTVPAVGYKMVEPSQETLKGGT